MRNVWLLLLLPLCVGQVNVQLRLDNSTNLSLDRFYSILQGVDDRLAGEPFATLVSYEDQTLAIKALDGQCAGGYIWNVDKCEACECIFTSTTVDQVYFRPLDPF